tara:strand:+ start:1422 stop:1841 length:420 start_codon:yes stop_codon:yes gene_type:complete
MDLFHKLIDLVDKNAECIPEGDYLDICNTIKEIRERVKPPPFLLDQNDPLWISDYDPTRDGPPVYTSSGQPQEWIDEEEERSYPGLNQFILELHEEWSRTDDGNEEEDETLSADEAMGQLREHIEQHGIPQSLTINFVD